EDGAWRGVGPVAGVALKASGVVGCPAKVSRKAPAVPATVTCWTSETSTKELLPALIAGLVKLIAIVWVGPPLSASGPSSGSPVIVSASPPLPSSIRLWLPERVPWLATSPPEVLLATMQLFNSIVPPLSMPPPSYAELLENVLLVTVSVPSLAMPPPSEGAKLPLTVLLVTVSVPLLKMPP